MTALGPRATPPDTARAFAAAEAAYLEPVADDEEIDEEDGWDEQEWEFRESVREEMER